MTGQVGRQDIKSVTGKIARWQDPDSVIHTGPMYEDHRLKTLAMLPGAGVGIDLLFVCL